MALVASLPPGKDPAHPALVTPFWSTATPNICCCVSFLVLMQSLSSASTPWPCSNLQKSSVRPRSPPRLSFLASRRAATQRNFVCRWARMSLLESTKVVRTPRQLPARRPPPPSIVQAAHIAGTSTSSAGLCK